jgi:hypothetical protein
MVAGRSNLRADPALSVGLSYNGGITTTSLTPPPNAELAIAESQDLSIESYVLDSIFTHKSSLSVGAKLASTSSPITPSSALCQVRPSESESPEPAPYPLLGGQV